ncbi:Uncharacterised protein [Shigella sonnei]|nr:Uncharacterised protein [Shigella sonnei]
MSHLIHRSVHHAGAVQDRAHTAIPARGLSAGRCHPAHKASFLPLRQELIASVVAHGWSEDRSVQTWKTPQFCSDASACCSSC